MVKEIEIELVQQELGVAIREADLDTGSAEALLSQFAPLFATAKALCADALEIAVTDATQLTEMKQARDIRLKLKAVRVQADNIRKKLKERSIREGKAIQGVYQIIEYAIVPSEERLEEMEKFAERAEAARKKALKEERATLLSGYIAEVALYPLGDMTQQAWEQLLAGAKAAHEAQIEAARKAEDERIAKAQAEEEERARIRSENQRLRREAEERESAAKIEREKAQAELRAAEAKAKAEREAIEAKASEEKAKADAERKAIEAKAEADKKAAAAKLKAAEDAARKEREKVEADRREAEAKAQAERDAAEAKAKAAAAAPDRDKINALAVSIRGLSVPSLSTEKGREVEKEIEKQLEKFADWLNKKAASL